MSSLDAPRADRCSTDYLIRIGNLAGVARPATDEMTSAADYPNDLRGGRVLGRTRQANSPSRRRDPRLPGVRVRELIAPLGFVGGKTIVDDYLREVRPLCLKPRTFRRTVYRPGEVCQFDLWHTTAPVPVGHGQTRQGYVVVAAFGYSRVGAGALIFSRRASDVLWGMSRCLWSLGAVPELLVWDREGCLHAGWWPAERWLCRLLRAAEDRLVLL
jgi:hypothetical protein